MKYLNAEEVLLFSHIANKHSKLIVVKKERIYKTSKVIDVAHISRKPQLTDS